MDRVGIIQSFNSLCRTQTPRLVVLKYITPKTFSQQFRINQYWEEALQWTRLRPSLDDGVYTQGQSEFG